MSPTPGLSIILKRLRTALGAPPRPVSTNPFHLILWEQVAYLVPDVVRLHAFRELERRVGLRPGAILQAPVTQLTRIARLGGTIAAADRAHRMQRSAELFLDRFEGQPGRLLALPYKEARRELARFPMIGEPGADKILAATSNVRLVPLDSNALRVIQRIGLAKPAADYRRAYAQAQDALAPASPRTKAGRLAAYGLLRQLGQDVCRRASPQCHACPLVGLCAIGQQTIRGT